MGEQLRVPPGPAVHRGDTFTFRFDGRQVLAHEGETVGAALHADGERILMRSIKYHRPRGLFCNTGACANCLVRVDGVPNVRACRTPVTQDMVVETQNSIPNARHDVLSIVDKVYRVKFDYHEKFIRPKILTPLYHKVIRRMAGFGELPDDTRPAPRRPDVERIHTDVVVVGAGPAGLSAAVAAAEGAAHVVLVDENPRAGGSLLLARGRPGERDGVELARDLLRRFEDAGGRYLPRSVAFGCYRTDGHGDTLPAPGILAVQTPQRMIEVHAKSLVVATGYHETPPRFPGNDLPGIMGARAALILLHRHGILPGRRILLTTDTPLARRAARDLKAAGADVIGIAGEGDLEPWRITAANGGAHVERATLEHVDGTKRHEPVDAILSAGDETPRVELLQQAGASLSWTGTIFTAMVADWMTTEPGVFAVGDILGAHEPHDHLDHGAAAGEAAARHARGPPS